MTDMDEWKNAAYGLSSDKKSEYQRMYIADLWREFISVLRETSEFCDEDYGLGHMMEVAIIRLCDEVEWESA